MAEETKLYDNENSSDDEITYNFYIERKHPFHSWERSTEKIDVYGVVVQRRHGRKYKSKPIDLLSADASTTPMDNSNASIAESIK